MPLCFNLVVNKIEHYLHTSLFPSVNYVLQGCTLYTVRTLYIRDILNNDMTFQFNYLKKKPESKQVKTKENRGTLFFPL